MSEAREPLCFVLSAPSGAGKTTIAHRVLERVDALTRTVSWTTRTTRPGEVDGRDYTFVEQGEFDRHRRADGFLESATVHGHDYGTPLSELERIAAIGHDALMVIDVQGAEQVRGKLDGAVTVFVLPPSKGDLEARLDSRDGADPANQNTIKRRLGVAAEEIAHFVRYDYVIINDDLDRAVRELESVVIAERCRQSQRVAPANEILESFR